MKGISIAMMRVARSSLGILRLCVVSSEFIGETIFVEARMAMRFTLSKSMMNLSLTRFMAPYSQRVAWHAWCFEHASKRMSIEAMTKASRSIANRLDATKKFFDFFCLDYQFGGPDRCCRAWKLLIASDRNSTAFIGELCV